VLHKFNTLVRLCIVAFLVIPFPVLAYHVTTQPAYDQSIAIDTTTGDITIGIYTSDGLEDSPPEKYTIFFDIDNDVTTNSFCVSTSFGHTGNLQWNYHTFSLSDLQTYFANPYGNFRTKIRSDNDTDNSFSTLTAQMAIDIPNQEPFVGVENWSEPTTTCNDTSTTTTTSSTLPPTTEAAAQEEVVEETTTTSSTTTTTEPPPPPPPTTTTTLYVVVNDDGSTSEYTESEVKDGTVDRDNERKANDEKWSCYMTNAQLERGDCDNYNASLVEEEVVEEKEEEVIIEEDEKEQPDTEEIISDDDVVVPEVVVDDKDKEPVDQPKEEVVEDELDQEIPGDDDIREEGVQEEDVKDEDNKEEEIKEEEEVEETKEIILEPEEEPEELEQEPVQDPVELTEEEIAVEVAEVEDIVEDIKEVEVEELETEQVIEVLAEVADVGVENLTEVSEDVLEVVSEVIEEVITIATEEVLTEEQVEVVQEVLNLEEPEDVQIIAEAVKEDEAVAEAVEEYVERAVENADVEDYNLADVVTEIQTEEFLADPVGAFTDIDIAAIDLTTLGDTMTSTQKEKAQEVVVPVIIASQIVASVQVVPVRIRRRV
jgi:hypothetical protein